MIRFAIKMKDPIVSIIIPIYNAEKSLPKCFISCLSQSYKDLEIIAINDCSSDRSGEICSDFASRYEQIKVIHHARNLGPQKARPAGLEKASGIFIFFLDADDHLPSKNAIHNLMQVQKTHDADVVFGGYEIKNAYGRQLFIPPTINSTSTDEQLLFFFKYPFRTLWAKVYRKSLFENLEIPDHIYHGEDLVLNTQILAKDKLHVISINELVYSYAKVTTSITHNLSFKNAINVLYAEEWVFNHLSRQRLLENDEVRNELKAHAVPKLIAAINAARNEKLERTYFKKLYALFYRTCPVDFKRRIAWHQRLLIRIEFLSPTLNSVYKNLLGNIFSLRKLISRALF